MIHSLSGGVIKENGSFLFAKVEIDGLPYWYLATEAVAAGDRVAVPFGRSERIREGIVLRTEECTAQTAPMPMNRIKEIIKKL